MKAELEEIAEAARGASEREIETEVVHLFKGLGWPRSQINQDVPISDKGADKADIVLRLDGQPVILVEVKKHGHSRDADNQVNRYCRLLRPSPKLALLTDGVRWVLYHVGQVGALPIQVAVIPAETASVVSMLNALSPEILSASLHAGVFQYLDIVEQALRERSEEAQKHLRPFFASTVKSLLMPGAGSTGSVLPVTMMPQNVPVQVKELAEKEQSGKASVTRKQPDQEENDTRGEYDPGQPPSLTFTTLTTASFAGNTATNWNDLLRISVKTALTSGQTKHDIQRITSVNIQDGTVSERGYSPLTGTDVSVQGQTADEAWQNALKLARKIGCVIEAKFRWRDNEKASHPGASGVLRWSP
jgi:hypothetical protein